MTTRAFLVRGLIAGLLAGVVGFVVAYTVGEPHVETAVVIEEAAAAPAAAHDHARDNGDGHAHEHASAAAPLLSRGTQRTSGLLTATLAVGTALGGLVAIAAAFALGRIGRLSPRQSTALVSLVGFVAVALVPFLKYPAIPPAVGSPTTIEERTAQYFGFLLISVVAAVAAVVVATKVWRGRGSYPAVLAGAGGYLIVVVVAAALLPTVDELGAFPASTLWSFRLGSLATLTALWATIGVVLAGLVGRLHAQDRAVRDRRALAASL
ncbi:MAG: CbtA family protein [Actinomycetota bacterium]|nr:CbtA family protein [Actinomycetota bacterium]